MDYRNFTGINTQAAFQELNSSTKGLSQSEASQLLDKIGENKIRFRETTPFDIFVRQFKSPFTYLLFAASLLSILLGERLDGIMIALFVILNAFLSFYQEYRSEQTVRLLKKYLASKIRVLREGKETDIETTKIVPGDIILLEPGDIIPADVRIIEDFNLVIDETVLTGESLQVSKTSNLINKKVNDIYAASNIGFSGTIVTSGKGKGLVFATGESTNYAGIVKLAGDTKRVSSFELELGKFSKFTLWVVLATLLFIVVTSIAVKPDPSLAELILFSIALAVSVIPETLPAVMTFCLSIGAHVLTKRGVVVKRLTSVEDLGALEVLATDKTGTLTENRLKVANLYGKNKDKTLLYSSLASYFTDDTRNSQSNAFDLAFSAELKSEDKQKIKNYTKITEIPFDPQRRRVTTLLKGSDGSYLLVSRGSFEQVSEISKISGTTEASKWVKQEGTEGRRTLAVSIKKINLRSDLKDLNLSDYEKDMEFVGLVSFADPIKPSSYSAVKKAKQLGVKVKIITGDSLEVAGQVAIEVGLIESTSEVITGSEFQKLNVAEKHEAVEKYSVFARIVPEQKHEIISLIKEKRYVGFLGEGINDAPALKAANVGVVVNGASDVAKEAADIVLLQKDLEVIMDGITEGRRVFANTSKYITATMASNFGNFFAIALIAPFISFLPMLPLQILLVNLLSDFPMIMVATDNVEPEVVSKPKRYDLRSFVVSALSFGFISTTFDFITFNSFVRMGESTLQTYWFIVSILTELMIIFSIRSQKSIIRAISPSKVVILLTMVTVITTVCIPFIPRLREIFGFVKPEVRHLITVFLIVLAYLLTNELAKVFIRWKRWF